MTLRYVPSEMFGRIGPRGTKYAVQRVVHIEAKPPLSLAESARVDGPIMPHLFNVCVTLESGAVRHFGASRAFIDSTLRMVIDVDDRDAVRSRWEAYAGE